MYAIGHDAKHFDFVIPVWSSRFDRKKKSHFTIPDNPFPHAGHQTQIAQQRDPILVISPSDNPLDFLPGTKSEKTAIIDNTRGFAKRFASSSTPAQGYAMKRRVVLRIWGRVQGVNYRRAAQREAVRLAVTGFARNMPDDSVWIEAEGVEDAISAFIDWCRKGPPRSEVETFDVQEGDLVGYKGFEIY